MPPQCRDLVKEINQVRHATSAFFSFDVAVAAGWDTAISPCVESPMGGMGYHWIGRHNPAGIFADWNPNVSCQFAPPPGD